MAGPIWMSVRTLSSGHFETSLGNPISLRSGTPGGVSSHPTVLPPHCSDRPGSLPPLVSTDPPLPPFPERQRGLRRQQDCSMFPQQRQRMGRRGRGERLFGCSRVGCVAFPSSPKPAPLIDISGWEAGSLRRAFDIKGVFTPPLHQSKLKLICAYTLLLKERK